MVPAHQVILGPDWKFSSALFRVGVGYRSTAGVLAHPMLASLKEAEHGMVLRSVTLSPEEMA